MLTGFYMGTWNHQIYYLTKTGFLKLQTGGSQKNTTLSTNMGFQWEVRPSIWHQNCLNIKHLLNNSLFSRWMYGHLGSSCFNFLIRADSHLMQNSSRKYNKISINSHQFQLDSVLSQTALIRQSAWLKNYWSSILQNVLASQKHWQMNGLMAFLFFLSPTISTV